MSSNINPSAEKQYLPPYNDVTNPAPSTSPDYRSREASHLPPSSGSYPDEKQQYLSPGYDSRDTGLRSSASSAGSYGSGDSDDVNADNVMIDEALSFARHASAPQSSARAGRLRRPVAIPQVSPKMGSPFARAYAPILEQHGIRILEFVEFIDNFNILLTGSPPLTALNMVGQGLGFVPNHWFALAGALTQVTVGVATYAIVKTRCATFVKKANAEFFGPRGVMVQVKKTEELAKICDLQLNDMMVQPLEPGADLAALGGALNRRLKAVEGHVEPLVLDVPPPTEQTNILAKMSAKQSAATQRKMEKKTMKEREKAAEKVPTSGDKMKDERKERKELAKLDREAEKVEREFEKETRKAQKEKPGKRLEKMADAEKERDKEFRKLDKERRKVSKEAAKEKQKDQDDATKEDKEVKASKKGLWIMVRNADEVMAELAQKAEEKENAPLGMPFLSRFMSSPDR